jgi:hypothetical protein
MFIFLRSLQIFFPEWLHKLSFPPGVYEGSFSPHPHQHLLVVFLMMAILTGVGWNLSVFLIFIFFMVRDGEYFFMHFFGHLNFFFW